MNLLSLFIVSFTIALVGAIAPGPFLTVVISESIKKGFKSGPLISLGHALAEVCMVALIIFGFTRFINNPIVLKIIYLLGASILFLFGTHMLISVPHLSLDFKTDYTKASNLILMGVTMTVANPYWTIWWLIISLGLVLGAQKQGFLAVGVFFIGHILADFLWYSMVSFAVSKGRKFISERFYKGIIFTCALMLIGFGIYLGINSFILPF